MWLYAWQRSIRTQKIKDLELESGDMKAKQRILMHLRRYKTITIIVYNGWGLSNLHARISELIELGHNIDRTEWHEIKSNGKVIKRVKKYRLR